MKQFIPFGFQYYRAPTPARSEWARDLQKIANDGYNTVKFWIQWRWNEPRQGEYFFDDIDELMDLSHRFGLKVVLNIILDVSPVWLIRDYPDSAMISAKGETVKEYATEYRQIGGVPGPCFHHKEAKRLKLRFVEECARRYADHPALLLWDVWNEPELTVGIYREPTPENLLCYCENCRREFGEYLSRKYKTVEKLNECWGRNYTAFNEAEPPKRRGTTADMVDWRLFFCDTITEDFAERVRAVKKYDTTHPVMCHTVPIPLFNSITCCSDDFSIAKYGDLVGNSVGSSPMAADMMKSAAAGKRILNSEIHACYGSALNGFRIPDVNDMIRHIFIPLAHGSKGFLFWQYRPELLGNEAPAWGNTALDGSETPWNDLTKKLWKEIEEYADVIDAFQPACGETAVYFDPANEIYSWEASFGTELFLKSITGVYNLFYRNNYAVDFIGGAQLRDRINKYRAVYFPATFLFDEEKTQTIFEYAERGGTVLFEALFACENGTTGRHCINVPGCGVAERLGIRLENIYSSTMIENGYDGKVFTANDGEKIPFSDGTRALSGAKYLVKNSGETGNVLATFESGAPAVCEYRVGKGRVICLNTLFAYGYEKFGGESDLAFLRKLVGKPNAFSDLTPGLRADAILSGERGFIVVENATGVDQKFTVPYVPRTVFGDCTFANGAYTIRANRSAVIKF